MHPTDDYDFVVHLDPTAAPRSHHNTTVGRPVLSKPLDGGHDRPPCWPGFDPVQSFCADLQVSVNQPLTYRLRLYPIEHIRRHLKVLLRSIRRESNWSGLGAPSERAETIQVPGCIFK
jgi:hypothetical protein